MQLTQLKMYYIKKNKHRSAEKKNGMTILFHLYFSEEFDSKEVYGDPVFSLLLNFNFNSFFRLYTLKYWAIVTAILIAEEKKKQ